MTATVFIDVELRKTYTVPNVNSLEEAESIALEMLSEEFPEQDEESFAVVGIDSFEGAEEMVN